MINKERLERIIQWDILHAIDHGFDGHDVRRERILSDVSWLIKMVKYQQIIIESLSETTGKLNEYLQDKVTDEWGNDVADAAIRLINKQQKEIERLNDAIEEIANIKITIADRAIEEWAKTTNGLKEK